MSEETLLYQMIIKNSHHEKNAAVLAQSPAEKHLPVTFSSSLPNSSQDSNNVVNSPT